MRSQSLQVRSRPSAEVARVVIGSDASSLRAAIAAREISPVEIVRDCFERIRTYNDALRAFVYINEEETFAEARAAEREIAQAGQRSPLHGIPVGYKDIIDVAGMPTTAGSRLLKDHIAQRDAGVVSRLRRCGTIALGKLNTFEFATGGQELFGETRNPWNLSYATGGSSTGPAAALAGRLVPLALGTDTGGSVRIPASFCGLVALRATRGTIDKSGVVPLSPTLDEVGPMTRTVEDCILLFDAMAGVSTPETPEDLRGIRIGVPAAMWAPCEPEVMASLDVARKTLQDLGATIHAVRFDDARYGVAASWAISYREAFDEHRENLKLRPTDYTPLFFNKISAAGELTAQELAAANEIRRKIAAEFDEALKTVDAVLVPATPYPAYPLGNQQLQLDNGAFTRPVSLAGLPALVVPCGMTAGGLPIGMQLVASAHRETLLFHLGRVYEKATSWHTFEPSFECTPIATPLDPVKRALHAFSTASEGASR